MSSFLLFVVPFITTLGLTGVKTFYIVNSLSSRMSSRSLMQQNILQSTSFGQLTLHHCLSENCFSYRTICFYIFFCTIVCFKLKSRLRPARVLLSFQVPCKSYLDPTQYRFSVVNSVPKYKTSPFCFQTMKKLNTSNWIGTNS